MRSLRIRRIRIRGMIFEVDDNNKSDRLDGKVSLLKTQPRLESTIGKSFFRRRAIRRHLTKYYSYQCKQKRDNKKAIKCCKNGRVKLHTTL